MIQLVQANAVMIPLGDGVVSLCVTSPPYWGLRSYDGEQVLTWGGVRDCQHVWGEPQKRMLHTGSSASDKALSNRGAFHGDQATDDQFCQRCNAWRGALGLEPTPDLFIAHLVEVFTEVRRVLTPDGLCFVNLGDSYASSGKSGTIDSKSPAFHGGGAYDDLKLGRAPSPPGIPAKNLCLIPQRAALAFQADGWWVRSFMPWPKNNALPESVRDRPTTSHEYWIMLAKSKRYFWDGESIKVGSKYPDDNRKSRSKTEHKRMPDGSVGGVRPGSATYPTRNRRTADTWLDGLDVMIDEQRRYLAHLEAIRDGTGMLTDQDGEAMALRFNTASFKGAHFATFPAKMIVPLVKAGSSERGVCPVCRAAWVRVVERERTYDHVTTKAGKSKDGPYAAQTGNGAGSHDIRHGVYSHATTTGWQPSCPHYPRLAEWPTYPRQDDDESDADYAARAEPIRQKRSELLAHWEPMETSPAIVLDTFVGSGTTLEVARALKRDGIGLDLSRPYLAEQARKRLGLTALAEWETGIKATGDPLTGLPMFARMEGE